MKNTIVQNLLVSGTVPGPGGRPLRLDGEDAVDNEGQVRAISAWMAHFYQQGLGRQASFTIFRKQN